MDPYLTKKLLLRPYVSLMKRFFEPEDRFMAIAFETHHYGPAFLKHILRYLSEPAVLYKAPVSDVRTILDVGAYDGTWSTRVSDRYPQAQVFAFEPTSGIAHRARRALADYERARLFQYGLSDRDETVDMIALGAGSTAFIGAAERLDPATPRTAAKAKMRDVKGVFDELGLERVDLLKVNIEGGEFPLFARLLETGYINRCRSIMVQFHEWYPDAYRLRRRIHKQLRRTHDLAWSDYFVWEQWIRKGESKL
jgi:FkbM family methyltransferase